MNSTTDIPETAQTFDPSTFTVVPARTFEDLRVGEIFRAPSRTLTDAHASAFQTVSADNHPIHYDVEYARRHGQPWRDVASIISEEGMRPGEVFALRWPPRLHR